MTAINKLKVAFMISGLFALSSLVVADDTEDLTHLLNEFLAGVSEADTHDRFWADDLIYTSSNGTRTNKAEIMSGFDAPEDEESD